MWHIMLDAYGCKTEKANDLRGIYETIYRITNYLSLSTIMPPVLVPYYYGSIREDDGISAFVLLKGGHFTIHTFPERECYFVDILYDGFINESKLEYILSQELPFEERKINNVDRRFKTENQFQIDDINEATDFGPHYLIQIAGLDFSFEKIFHFLDCLPKKINMDPIFRPYVISDKIENCEILSGITIIAQSHIAVHYFKKLNLAYIDIFSCSFINCNDIVSIIKNDLNVKSMDYVLIGRGSKHYYKLGLREEMIQRYDGWKKNIQ